MPKPVYAQVARAKMDQNARSGSPEVDALQPRPLNRWASVAMTLCGAKTNWPSMADGRRYVRQEEDGPQRPGEMVAVEAVYATKNEYGIWMTSPERPQQHVDEAARNSAPRKRRAQF